MTGDFDEGRGNVAWQCNRLSFGCFILAILAYPVGIRSGTPKGRGTSTPGVSMSDTSRRSVLTGAVGLAAGSALPLPPMPALAQAEPFRIEPPANYVEYRRLAKLMADSEWERHNRLGGRYEEGWHEPWDRMKTLLKAMSSKSPQTASDLLDYAAVMLWHYTGLGHVEVDPCEVLNDAGERLTEREHSAFQ
jgi:hypothetical protein